MVADARIPTVNLVGGDGVEPDIIALFADEQDVVAVEAIRRLYGLDMAGPDGVDEPDVDDRHLAFALQLILVAYSRHAGRGARSGLR